MATAINRELRDLVASGCSVIQIEEPTIHFIACYYPEATDTLNFLTEALNHELEGLENAGDFNSYLLGKSDDAAGTRQRRRMRTRWKFISIALNAMS